MSEPVAPVVNTLNAPFWDAAADGRLVLPYCTATGRAFWPPSPASPFVTGGAVAWRTVEPVGTLAAIAVYRRGFQKVFAHRMPYGIGLIALDCGARIQAHISNPDAKSAPRRGARVRIAFERLADGGPPVPVVVRLDLAAG